jgi:hypothetical protein
VSSQTWQETLVWATGDGAAYTGNGTPTSIIPTQAKYVLPAGFANTLGKTFRVTAKGRISNIATTPGTLAVQVQFGGVGIWAPAAVALNTTVKTNVTWWLETEIVVRTTGTAATLLGIGQLTTESLAGAVAGNTLSVNLPASAPVVGSAVDLTTALSIDLLATFSLTGNSLTAHTYKLESLN